MEAIEPKSMNYIGSSMNPTLKPGVRLHLRAYQGQKIRRGDVIVFISPEDGSKVVHRVISVDSNGIKTRGDNCNHEDDWVLSREDIIGRVVSAQRGNRQRKILGGLLGRLYAVSVRVIRAIDSPVSCLLHPAYDEVAKAGIFIRLLPLRMRPRVISFNRDAGTELQLVMGRRVIGRRLEGKAGWNIRRPFRLFVDEASLPGNPARGSVVRC